jgi:exopolyphosphatase/guanosine-5'-triphosphate,3'-diphosphate pyrophosphatase
VRDALVEIRKGNAHESPPALDVGEIGRNSAGRASGAAVGGVTNHSQIAAAIDIGSNTIKLTVARVERGSIVPIAGMAEVVRLGQGIAATGRIADDRVEAALLVLRTFAGVARLHGAESIYAVATEALRIAENGPALLERLRTEIGIDASAIDGAEEARLTAAGVLSQIESTCDALIVDIGGGSTELIATRQGDVLRSVSLPLGSGVMTDRLVPSDPPRATELDAVETRAGDLVEPFFEGLGQFDRLIVVGGTGEYLMALFKAEQAVHAGALDRARATAERMTAAELAPVVGAPVARARVLPAGFAIARAVNRLAGSSRIESVANGLRIGLLVELAGAMSGGDQVQ